jgi:hypothetical protein
MVSHPVNRSAWASYGELILTDECGFGEAAAAEAPKQTDPIAAHARRFG